MLTLQDQIRSANVQNDDVQSNRSEETVRDIHALIPEDPHNALLPPPPAHRRYSPSVNSSDAASSNENFSTTISREFNALVIAGSSMENNQNSYENSDINDVSHGGENRHQYLSRIGEEYDHHQVPAEETNPLAIVPDNSALELGPGSGTGRTGSDHTGGGGGRYGEVTSVQRVKREEVDSKIAAWQNAKIAKINNRFKREDAIIKGWESEQVQKANSRMKKIERKLEEKRARALEKMENDVAKAHRKAEERRASAESKRGTKVARVFEVANLMRAVGRAPAKRSIFSFG